MKHTLGRVVRNIEFLYEGFILRIFENYSPNFNRIYTRDILENTKILFSKKFWFSDVRRRELQRLRFFVRYEVEFAT